MFNNLKQLWARSSKLRYLLVGLFNTGIAFLLYAVLVSLGMNFAIANFIALCFGILFSYQTIKRIVFETKDKYTPVRYLILWVVLFFRHDKFCHFRIYFTKKLGLQRTYFYKLGLKKMLLSEMRLHSLGYKVRFYTMRHFRNTYL